MTKGGMATTMSQPYLPVHTGGRTEERKDMGKKEKREWRVNGGEYGYAHTLL